MNYNYKPQTGAELQMKLILDTIFKVYSYDIIIFLVHSIKESNKPFSPYCSNLDLINALCSYVNIHHKNYTSLKQIP